MPIIIFLVATLCNNWIILLVRGEIKFKPSAQPFEETGDLFFCQSGLWNESIMIIIFIYKQAALYDD